MLPKVLKANKRQTSKRYNSLLFGLAELGIQSSGRLRFDALVCRFVWAQKRHKLLGLCRFQNIVNKINGFIGGSGGFRTHDQGIMSPLL